MICNCNIVEGDYSIEIIQGDYVSVVYTLTDEFDDKIENIGSLVFTCARQNLQQTLTELSPTEFMLVFNGEDTLKMNTFRGATYDITLNMKGSSTPITLVHNASFTVLKKDNPTKEQEEEENGSDSTDENV